MPRAPTNVDRLKEAIRHAFANVEAPPHWSIIGSNEGDEPALLQREFESIPVWDTLPAEFLDQSPNGYGTALCFFSDEAFRYYLPAFLIADLDRLLQEVDVVFHLCHGFGSKGDEAVNPRRYGSRTMRDEAKYRFAMFTREQASVIVEFLIHRAARDKRDEQYIKAALDEYWHGRAESRAEPRDEPERVV